MVREAEWLVRSCTATDHDGFKIRATGVSEPVRDEDAVFFTELENPQPELLDPEKTILVADETPRFTMSRLFLEATLRRTPLPQSERRLALPDRFLLDPLTYQQRPAELALKGLRPRILLADVVGLGKTLEIGLILAELIRRGRGDRILVVTPQQVLEQFQQELWTRFAIPLIRLDSVGVQRIQREIPTGRNPFTFYKRIIISIDTLKGDAYRHHLDTMHWDAVVIDEYSHIDVELAGMPAEEVELRTFGNGQYCGRFMLTPTPGSKPTLQSRLVAVTLADLAGRAPGSAVPYRAER